MKTVRIPYHLWQEQLFSSFYLQERIKLDPTTTDFRGHYWKLWTMVHSSFNHKIDRFHLTNVLSWKNTQRTSMLNAWRKPQKANINEGVSSYNSEIFILCWTLPILPFILQQAVANILPAVSSVCSGLQFGRSVRAQCGELQQWRQRKCSGVGEAVCLLHRYLSTLSWTLLLIPRTLWHHQCKS